MDGEELVTSASQLTLGDDRDLDLSGRFSSAPLTTALPTKAAPRPMKTTLPAEYLRRLQTTFPPSSWRLDFTGAGGKTEENIPLEGTKSKATPTPLKTRDSNGDRLIEESSSVDEDTALDRKSSDKVGAFPVL